MQQWEMPAFVNIELPGDEKRTGSASGN